jgi:FkbM family methyltransferase
MGFHRDQARRLMAELTKIIGGTLPWSDKTSWLWPMSDRERLQRWFRDGPGDLDAALPMLLPHLKDRRTVVQAGGCVGIWPVRLSQFFSTVRTFEPEPVNFSCLEANTAHLANVIPVCAALGELEKRVSMVWPEMGRKAGNPGTFHVGDGSDAAMMTIDSLELDDCDLIYLDIEGYEVAALRGAAETIERCSPVIGVEDYGAYMSRFGLPNVIRWLAAKHGYKLIGRPEGQHDAILVRE